MHRLIYLLSLFLFLTALPTLGQTVTVRGTVVDASDGAPLPGTSVVIGGTARGTAADAEGRFTLGPLRAGTYTLEARLIGYRPAKRIVTLYPGETATIDFRLQTQPVGLEGIEVTALRPDLGPAADLDARRIRETHATDAGELMRVLPGLNAARRGAVGFDPNVRGLTETEVGAYIDGVRFFPAGPLRMDSQISHFDPSSIAKIEVVKGPYALMWGAGNMSAIRVERQGFNPTQGVHGTLQTGYTGNLNGDTFGDAPGKGVELAGSVSGAEGKLFYWLHGAYRDGDDYIDGDDDIIPSDYVSREVRGRVGVQLAPNTRVYVAAGFHRQDDIDYPGRLLDADFFEALDLSARFQMTRPDGMLRGLDAHVYWNDVTHDMDNDEKPTRGAGTFPNGSPRPPLIIRVETASQNIGGRVAADLAPMDGLDVTLGGDVYVLSRDARRPFFAVMPNGNLVVPPFYATDEVWPDVTISDVGLFAGGTRAAGALRFSGTLRLDLVQADVGRPSASYLANLGAGLTADDLSASEANLSAAVTAAAPLSDAWRLSVGLGSVVRTADALERYADRFPASKAQTSAEFVGNPTLAPERSTQVDVWLDGVYPRLSLTLNAFARQMTDYITLEPTDTPKLLPLSPDQVFRYVNGEAQFYGFEAAAAFALTDGLTTTLGGSYLFGDDTSLDEPALGVSPPAADLGLRYDDDRGRFFVQGNLRLTAEQTRVATTRGEQPTDGYATADLRVGLSLVQNVSLLLGVTNLTDTAYVNHLNARNPFNGMALYEPGRTFFANLRVAF